MKRWMGLAVAACLLLTGCGQKTEPAREAAEEPWRAAYSGFLEELCEKEKRVRDIERPDYDPNTYDLELGEVSGTYVLYDIDKDGVPEMMVRYGMGEAGYHTTFYGYRDGAVEELGDIPTGHTSLYTWPGENGIAYNWGHMGGHFIDKITLVDGQLEETPFFEEGPTDTYTSVEELIPGSRYLEEVRTTVQLPERMPLTLPIADYGNIPLNEELDSTRDAAAREAITEVVQSGCTFYAVSADGFGGDAGETTLEDYLQPGGITEYAERPLLLKAAAWVDVDRDGASEYVLRIENDTADYTVNQYLLVLSGQSGTVYGYCLNYTESKTLDTEGVFHDFYAEGAGNMRMSFRENQAYLYTAPDDGTVPSVEWQAP